MEDFLSIVLSILFPSVIPAAILLYLGWSFFRMTPDGDQSPPDSSDHDHGRWHRAPRPRGPRRGPHAPGELAPSGQPTRRERVDRGRSSAAASTSHSA